MMDDVARLKAEGKIKNRKTKVDLYDRK